MIDQLQQIILETSIKHIGTKVKTLGLLPKVLELTNYLPENSTITQRIWHIINKTTKYKCSCGNNLKFLGIVKGYTVGCSNNCIDTIKSKSNKIKEVKSKITLKQQKNINEKRKETLLKKYNVSHNSKIAKVVKNRKQTYFKNKKAGKHKTSIGFKDVNTREKASSMFKKKNPGYLVSH